MKRLVLAALVALPGIGYAVDQGLYVSVVNAGGLAPITDAGSAVTLSRFDLGTGAFNWGYDAHVVVDGTDYLQGGISTPSGPNTPSLAIPGFSQTVATGVRASSASENPRGISFVSATTGAQKFVVLQGTSGNQYGGGSVRSISTYVPRSIFSPVSTVSGEGQPDSSGVLGFQHTGSASSPSYVRFGSEVNPFQNTRTLLGINYQGSYQTFSTYRGAATGYGFTTSESSPSLGATADPVGATFAYGVDGVTVYIAETGRFGAPGGVRKVFFANNAFPGPGVTQAFYPVSGIAGASGALQVAFRPGEYNSDGQSRILVTTYTPNDGPNALLSIIDNNQSTSPTIELLAQAGPNERFRGVTSVPEPASLFALGLGALALRKRRRS